MLELLSLPFLQRALAAAAITGLLGGLLGVFLVQRRMSFLAAGVSHGAFSGIGLGLYLGVAPFLVAVPVAVGLGLLIAYLRRRGALAEDTVVGVFFAAGMATGVILLSLSDANASLSAYLFGSILAIQWSDLLWLGAVAVAVLAFLLPAWGALTLITFDRELAQASGLPVRVLDYGFFGLSALAIVASVKLIGIVLVASFFVVPAASARLLGATFAWVSLLAALLGLATAVGGLLLSYPLNAPVGALIVLLQALVFAALLVARRAG
ncbi:metal ABC transporter permease [Thiohalorhabdus sp. Cl-TMA]|uniref:Metal ABC transporter permease n=1 Tax=Thiohalorhabdus methylotrophus TaxID=3242694 RepID=A0ABV4TQ24_9GAMM